MILKIRLHEHCRWLVQQKIADLEAARREAQGAANEETKSSAGDKYETGRAMMHLEQEKLARQQAEALKLHQVLDQINPHRTSDQVMLGSLVETNHGTFYVAVSLGNVAWEDDSYFVISPVAPIGQALLGLRAGDAFTFNGNTVRIDKVQ